MKLNEVFIVKEDANTASDRGHAADVYHNLLAALKGKKHSPHLSVKKGHEGLEAIFDIGKVIGDESLVGLTLSFDLIDNTTDSFADGTEGMFSPPGGSISKQGVITLYTRNLEGTRVSADSWKKHVVLNGSELFSDKHDFFIHEFIHYLDQKRDGFDNFNADGDEQYYNDPREVTAYMQQTFTKVENLLLSGGGKAIMSAAKQGDEQFKKIILKSISGVKKLNPDNLKKLEKSVADFRKYIVDKFGE